MENSKLVSVILPVKDGSKYICQSIKSVLNQTYHNFELIIINDGSADNTVNLIRSFIDSRIQVLDTGGLGLVYALNIGIEHSTGEYIARMDADDICLPDRFLIQVNILENNKDVGVVCSDVEFIDENGNPLRYGRSKIKNKKYLIDGLTFKNDLKPIIHPSVMMRKTLLQSIKGYREYTSAEDRDLWLRLVSKTNFFKASEVLLKYRITQTGISRSKYLQQKTNSMLSVLNYEFYINTNIDLYVDYPDVLEHFYKDFYIHSIKLKEGFDDFQQFKEVVQSSKVEAIIKLFSLIFNYKFFGYILFRRISDKRRINSALKQLNMFMQVYNNFKSKE